MRTTEKTPFPYDPFNPPFAAIATAARLLAEELMTQGIQPESHPLPDNHMYIIVVPTRWSQIKVQVRACFYTWPDPDAEYGEMSHAPWGEHTTAATDLCTLAGRS